MTTTNADQFWGYHAMFDAKACKIESVTNADTIRDFLKELVIVIDMIAYGEPQVIHFGEDDKRGFTGLQYVTTSNLIGHWNDTSGDVYFDIFSCKPYDVKSAEDLFRKYFEPQRLRVNYITRQA